MEADTACVRLFEHAIDCQSMQMWIQIERAAEDLGNPHGAPFFSQRAAKNPESNAKTQGRRKDAKKKQRSKIKNSRLFAPPRLCVFALKFRTLEEQGDFLGYLAGRCLF